MLSGTLFDVLFNIQKFPKFETRDPFRKMRREDGFDGVGPLRFSGAARSMRTAVLVGAAMTQV